MVATDAPEPVRRRRHGSELEAALLEAGWDELLEAGYAHLTMESIARRAHTSEAVLYRRWPNKDQLVLAAFEHYRDQHPLTFPDTGALRSDLIAEITAVSQARAAFFAIAAAASYAGLLAATGLSPAQVRAKIMGSTPAPPVRPVYQRAHDRGEIDLAKIPPAVLEMPFDLVRHDLYMDLKAPEPARITSVIDELFLPLLKLYQDGQVPSGAHPHQDGAAPSGP